MYIFIDTSKDFTIVSLLNLKLEEISSIKKEGMKNQSENLLKLVDKVLTNNEKNKKDIEAIFVFVGPGSYTGLRVGVATANALAFSLKIKVIGVEKKPTKTDLNKFGKSAKTVMPKYSNPAKITEARSRL